MQYKTPLNLAHIQFVLLLHIHTHTYTHTHSIWCIQSHCLISAQLAADPAACEAPTIQILRMTRSSSSSALLPSSHSLFASHSLSLLLWMLSPSRLSVYGVVWCVGLLLFSH